MKSDNINFCLAVNKRTETKIKSIIKSISKTILTITRAKSKENECEIEMIKKYPYFLFDSFDRVDECEVFLRFYCERVFNDLDSFKILLRIECNNRHMVVNLNEDNINDIVDDIVCGLYADNGV